MSPKAYSYIRFSTPEQLKGDSLHRQTELSERYAAKHGLLLDDSLKLQDLGVSAYSGEHRSNRGALGQFLKLIEAGKVEEGSCLLVESLDRLSREQITEALEQFLAIIGKGIKIITLTDNREYTRESINANVGELIISLTIMARAHEESSTKAMRLGKAWEGKRGRISDRKLTARCPAWLQLNKAKTQFDIIEDRKETVCQIFDMKLAGKGATSIIRELNSTPGIWKPGSKNKKKQGEGWRESYVRKILQSRSVIGEFQPHRSLKGKRKPIGEAIPDYFPAVIDKDIFYRVQEKIKSNLHKGGRTGKVSNLFSYIAKCGYCGSSMALIDKGPAPKGGQYLVCDRARRKSIDCCSISVRYNEFETLILTYCKGIRPQDILSKNSDTETAITVLKGELDGKTGELNSIVAEIGNIADSVSTTPDKRVREMLEKRMAERFDKQDSLKQQMNQLKHQIDTLSRSFEDTQLTLDSLKELLVFISTAETKNLIVVRLKLRNDIRKLISSIDVYPAGRPRFTSQTAKKALEAISMIVSEDEDPEGYARVKEDFRLRVESPKDFRFFMIHFISGSVRIINPDRERALCVDFDKEEGVLRIWNKRPNGRIIREEYSEDGVKIKHYSRAIGLNGEEDLQEIVDEACEDENRKAQTTFQRIKPYLNTI